MPAVTLRLGAGVLTVAGAALVAILFGGLVTLWVAAWSAQALLRRQG